MFSNREMEKLNENLSFSQKSSPSSIESSENYLSICSAKKLKFDNLILLEELKYYEILVIFAHYFSFTKNK
jgi:hypothetical protein